MLVRSNIDGLTLGMSVYRNGAIFKIHDSMAEELRGLSDTQVEMKLKKIYGRPIFRKPTVDEIIEAHRNGSVKVEDLDTAEHAVVLQRARSEAQRKLKATEILFEREEVHIEDVDGVIASKQVKSEKIDSVPEREAEDVSNLDL